MSGIDRKELRKQYIVAQAIASVGDISTGSGVSVRKLCDFRSSSGVLNEEELRRLLEYLRGVPSFPGLSVSEEKGDTKPARLYQANIGQYPPEEKLRKYWADGMEREARERKAKEDEG